MGWATGSAMAQVLYDDIRDHLAPSVRRRVAKIIFDTFDECDADDWDADSQLAIDSGRLEKNAE